MLVAGEEDPVHRPPRLLQPGPGLASGDDHDVPGRYADHQLTGDGPLQVVPELIHQQGAGLHAVEGEHQCRRLPVQTQSGQRRVQVVQRLPPQGPPADPEAVQVRPGHHRIAVRRNTRVGHHQAGREVLQQMVPAVP